MLILVPEIALTPQVAAQFRAAFGERVAIQHSGLADGERHDQWHRIRRGEVDLVVGTRSAVFAPLDRLGLIVVDEEHDSVLQAGRDAALQRPRRRRRARARRPVRSSCSDRRRRRWRRTFNAAAGPLQRVVLSRRVLDRPLAGVRVVDMREEYAATGPDVVLSATLVEAHRRAAGAGEQTLLLLNRRGYATSVFCRQCGARPGVSELQRDR